VAAQPLLFTVAFRRKMAELSQADRLEWLASLAARARGLASLRPRAGEADGTSAEGGVVKRGDEDSSSRPRSGEAGDVPSDPLLVQELREVARGCRLPLVDAIERQLGPFSPLHLHALLEVPRERFVRSQDVERSAEDTPLPLDDQGLSTISAPHAYLLSYRLLALAPGDSLVELGTGSGYGAALASVVVGPRGRVVTIEIDAKLAEWSKCTLAEYANVTAVYGDAVTSTPSWGNATKVAVAFAVDDLPTTWLDALPEGGALVAPVGEGEKDQRLVLVKRERGRLTQTQHGLVRYVKNRSRR
jgi:protein-L-isoaspartate(D-aspartate) O-methyltransferase